MAERVHPGDESPSASTSTLLHQAESPSRPTSPFPEKPVPSPGTYVIQIPKDQVYRIPPPENDYHFKRLSRRKPRATRCRFCCCWFLGIVASLILLAGIAAGVFYFVVRPEAMKYSIESISIKNFNVSSPSPLSPEFDVTVRADNPNNKIGVYYLTGSSVGVFHEDAKLSTGRLPVFFQGKNNVTVFTAVLKGTGVELTSDARRRLVGEANGGEVPLKVDMKVPVKIKVGSVKSWKITVNVDCQITVDKLTANAKIVSKKCDYDVDTWW